MEHYRSGRWFEPQSSPSVVNPNSDMTTLQGSPRSPIIHRQANGASNPVSEEVPSALDYYLEEKTAIAEGAPRSLTLTVEAAHYIGEEIAEPIHVQVHHPISLSCSSQTWLRSLRITSPEFDLQLKLPSQQ